MPSAAILDVKKNIVETLANEIKDARSIVLSNYQGLTVQQDTKMRKAFREEKLNYRVVKNTVLVRALEKNGITGMDDVLIGPTAIAWSNEDVVLAPRMVKKFVDEFKKTEIKGGVVEGAVSTLEMITALSNIPSLDVLHGQLVTTLIFPVRKLAMTLGALQKKAEEKGAQSVAELLADAPQAAAAESSPAENAEPAQEAAAPVTEENAAPENGSQE